MKAPEQNMLRRLEAIEANGQKIRRDMIEDWDDERDLGHGWFCYLKPGWSFEFLDECGTRSFDTKREAMESIVYPVLNPHNGRA